MKILIPLECRTKKNSPRIVRQGGRPILLPSKAYIEFEKHCKPFLKPLKIDKAVNLKCLFYMKTRRKVDLPNLLNSICDVLVKYQVITDDNKEIVAAFDGSRVLYDKNNPRIEIEITEMGVNSILNKGPKEEDKE